MKIVCIGAGRLAHHLMPALESAGSEILQVFNRSLPAAHRLCEKLKSAQPVIYLQDLDHTADLYFIVVSDDAVSTVANQLIEGDFADKTLIHCSGSLNLEALPVANRGIFYPLQTFSHAHETDWSQSPIIITSDNKELLDNLHNLAVKITGMVYEMNDRQKSVLHLSAVFANNFSNHMLKLAADICHKNNVPFEILMPLIRTTFLKALQLGPDQSQTGPAVRGDDATIEKHLELLRNEPEWIEIYKVITNSIRHR